MVKKKKKNLEEISRQQLIELMTPPEWPKDRKAPPYNAIVEELEKRTEAATYDAVLTLLEGAANRFRAGAQFAIAKNDLVGKQQFAADAFYSAVQHIRKMRPVVQYKSPESKPTIV